ncbi:MAG: PadR family transcriptional regulator [Chloroflexi bacterium]|nr:PadR family transcriptional regulator [Chloroflexota bacterium]
MTGYEVKQFFDSTVQHFWNAELSQIYPTLKSLEEASFVDKHVEVQENRPNRKVYEITDRGREEFLRWVREPQAPSDLRDPFMIKIFFGEQTPVEDVLILLRRQMEEQQKILAFSETVLRSKIREGVRKNAALRNGLYWTLTLDMANAYRRAYIDWCAGAMAQLEESLLGIESSVGRGEGMHVLPRQSEAG